jgi:abnormal spindle-like microcephaly-associated protein
VLMKAIKILEGSTKESYPCCKIIADARSPEMFYNIIRSCNRSDPHTKLLECLLNTLSNVSNHSSLIASITNDNSVDVLVDVIQLFRDKNEIFCAAVHILKRIVLSNNVFMVSAKRSIF